jgi:hypothetical protein
MDEFVQYLDKRVDEKYIEDERNREILYKLINKYTRASVCHEHTSLDQMVHVCAKIPYGVTAHEFSKMFPTLVQGIGKSIIDDMQDSNFHI